MSLYLGENLISGNKPINLGVRNIGEIVPLALPVTDAGLHLLDGGLILGGGIYQGFVDYIADLYTQDPTANYFTTEALWQTAVTTYGVCGKFVYDSTNNTVRLPKVTGKIEGTTDITALGDLAPLLVKLPNITGSFGTASQGQFWAASGSFYKGSGFTGNGVNNTANMYVNFDASRSSSVYSGNGTDTTIHEQAIKVLYYIVIANSTKTDIQVDIDEVVTDLNGKADVDLTNCTDVANIKMAHNAMPSNTYINLTLGASGSTYTAPANGWFTIEGVNGTMTCELYNDMMHAVSTSLDNSFRACGCIMPCKKGGIVTAYYNGTIRTFRFYYAVGSESEV